GIRLCRVGMVDPLHQGPCPARNAANNRSCCDRTRIEGFDAQSVVSLTDQPPVERRALQRGLDQLAPLGLTRRWKFGGKGKLVSHWGKMAQSALSGYCTKRLRQTVYSLGIDCLRGLVNAPSRNHAAARDLGQRHEHKGALKQSWMRQGQVRLVYGQIVVGKDINIGGGGDRAFFLGAGAARA